MMDMGLVQRLACIPSLASGMVSLVLVPLSILSLSLIGIGEGRQEADIGSLAPTQQR